MSKVNIPLFDGIGDPPAGYWKKLVPQVVQRFKAELTCPFGHGMVLKNHSIDSDGLVSPSVVCKSPGCQFHEFVILDKWAAPEGE